jgi:hypothetical protein
MNSLYNRSNDKGGSMKKLMFIILFFLVSCMSYQAPPVKQEVTRPAAVCENPEGYEYICYNGGECRQYLSGYAAIMKERFMAQEDGWFIIDGDVQRVDINLFYDHEGIYIIGYMIGTRHGDRVWIDVTTWACDIELNLVEPPGTLGGWADWEL